MMLKILNQWLLVLVAGLAAVGCATLPDTDALIARHSAQEALNTPKAFFERLSKAGMPVLEFNPMNPLTAKGPWQINNRDHRKLTTT